MIVLGVHAIVDGVGVKHHGGSRPVLQDPKARPSASGRRYTSLVSIQRRT